MRAAARRDWSTVALLGPPLFFLLLVFALPLARVVCGSFFALDFTLEYYRRMWTVPVSRPARWLPPKSSALTTLLCVLLGDPAAYFLASARHAAADPPRRRRRRAPRLHRGARLLHHAGAARWAEADDDLEPHRVQRPPGAQLALRLRAGEHPALWDAPALLHLHPPARRPPAEGGASVTK